MLNKQPFMLTHLSYFIIPLFFIACSSSHEKKTGEEFSNEILDTIKTKTININANPILFEAAFIKGAQHKVNSLSYNLYGITIGKLKVPTGRLIACDPMISEEYGIPFTQQFPTGEFPVQLSIAQLVGAEEEAIAFARTNFSDAPVVRWEFALLKGQDKIPVGSKERHTYIVDSGIGSFMDEASLKAVDQRKITDSDSEVFAEMDKHKHFRWRYQMYNFGNHNLTSFTSGFGDGNYSTYIGFDAQGKPCRLLTDFEVLRWSLDNK